MKILAVTWGKTRKLDKLIIDTEIVIFITTSEGAAAFTAPVSLCGVTDMYYSG